MWVFLNNAFVSIVAHRDKPKRLLVRARRRGDIERVASNAKVAETKSADYRYRAVIPREAVSASLAEQAQRIAYDNVKASIPPAESERHRAYLDVWATIRSFQDRPG